MVKNEDFRQERPQNHHDSIHYAGGGVALLYASKSLDAVKEKLDNFDQTVGVQILQTALRVPLKTIADNAGKPCLLCQCCPLRCAGDVLKVWDVSAAAGDASMHGQRHSYACESSQWHCMQLLCVGTALSPPPPPPPIFLSSLV